ncbi:MAG: hypothetical protein ACE5IP_13580, partial [Terriglobia bacterium]
NAALDQTSGAPALSALYRVSREGREVASLREENGKSIQFFSRSRAVLLRGLSLKDLEPGSYQLHVEIEDRVAGGRVVKEESFVVENPAAGSS